MMSVMVIACYRPKPGKEASLLGLLKTHLPILRSEGLVGDGPSLCGKAKDGTIVEVFSWKSQEAIDRAHENLKVLAMWENFADACEYVKAADIQEAHDMFFTLTPLELS